jgi:hypothetical protein
MNRYREAKERPEEVQKEEKTYNSRYSLVVTHLTTNLPVNCLNRAERTGSLVISFLWSYVLLICNYKLISVIFLSRLHENNNTEISAAAIIRL